MNGLVQHLVLATDVRAGDYLDSRGKIRVHATLTRGEAVTLAWRLRGSRAPGVRCLGAGDVITVWRGVRRSQPPSDDAAGLG